MWNKKWLILTRDDLIKNTVYSTLGYDRAVVVNVDGDCLRTMSSVLVGVYKYLPYPDFFNGSASISNCSLEIQPF